MAGNRLEMVDSWGDAELAAAVEAYRKMAELEALRKPYSKRGFFRDLVNRFGRTEKAFEYSMQNISAVLNELGKIWIPGLKPAENIGANVKSRIVALVERWGMGNPAVPENEASYKAKLPFMRDWLIEVARHKGQVTYGQVMEVFGIDRFSLRHAMDILGHQADNLDEPIITALIIGKKTRRCSSGLAKEFGVDDDSYERQRLYDFWCNSYNENAQTKTESTDLEVKAARFVSVEARPDQAAFRREVYLAYKGTCVISGCDVLKVLDAAHKHGRDWRLGHNRAEDGYLLRKDLHALYDNNLLRITDEGTVELDLKVMAHYKQFAGIILFPGACKDLKTED